MSIDQIINRPANQSIERPNAYHLAAMLVPGLARDYWKRLQHQCVLPLAEYFTESEIGLMQKRVAPKLMEKISWLKSHWDQQVAKLEKKVIENKITFVSIESSEYPEKLRSIADPPLGLFVKGNSKLLNQRQLAIVGSRRATRQALELTRTWAKKITQHSIVVTSGMALGIDAAAHLGALDVKNINSQEKNNHCLTIAVLGCGLQHVYPKQHWQLWQKIIDSGGAIVSEYLPDVSAKAQYFPQRNRIISGMSEGVIVIEAALKSGSLITARLANEQGREVFALPGNVGNSNASGCHYLIQQGAKLVTKIEDVFDEYVWGGGLSIHHGGNQVVDRAADNLSGLDRKESKVLSGLIESETSVDDIVEESGLAFVEVCSILLGLEIKGLVRKTPNGYQKII